MKLKRGWHKINIDIFIPKTKKFTDKELYTIIKKAIEIKEGINKEIKIYEQTTLEKIKQI